MKRRLAGTELAVVGLALVCGCGLSGCGDIEWWWSHQQPRRQVRPTPRPIGQPPSAATATHPAPPGGEPAATESPRETASVPSAAAKPAFHQLVLLQEASSASESAAPGFTQVRLEHASARAAGKLLEVLYTPLGPAGTADRYTLIYATRVECQAAAEVGRDLDVSAVEQMPAGPPEQVEAGWRLGVGLLHAASREHADYRQRLELAEACLLRVLGDDQQPVRRRWAAGLLAGWVRGHHLHDDAAEADHLRQVNRIVPAGTLEDVVTRYALARALIQEGQADAARRLLTDLVETSDAFGDTEAFKQAAQTLNRLEGERRR